MKKLTDEQRQVAGTELMRDMENAMRKYGEVTGDSVGTTFSNIMSWAYLNLHAHYKLGLTECMLLSLELAGDAIKSFKDDNFVVSDNPANRGDIEEMLEKIVAKANKS